jgi:predicted nuclease with TOPRIM domain
MYWRKDYVIHSWFVNNIQNGVDNCGIYYVSKEKLQELHDTIFSLLKKKKNKKGMVKEVMEKLGSTEIDSYCWEDLEETKSELKKILDRKDDMAEYYYHASW